MQFQYYMVCQATSINSSCSQHSCAVSWHSSDFRVSKAASSYMELLSSLS